MQGKAYSCRSVGRRRTSPDDLCSAKEGIFEPIDALEDTVPHVYMIDQLTNVRKRKIAGKPQAKAKPTILVRVHNCGSQDSEVIDTIIGTYTVKGSFEINAIHLKQWLVQN